MKRTRLRPVSPKRAIQNREYEKAKRVWRKTHAGRCEMIVADRDGVPVARYFPFIPGAHQCSRRAMNNPHHTKGRGKNLCAIETFMGVCAEHHRWIDTHRKQAVALGYYTYEFR